MTDATLDRLFRHMAWANAEVFAKLQQLPDQSLQLTLPGSDNTVADIAHHIATAARRLAARVAAAQSPADLPVPQHAADLAGIAAACAQADEWLRELAQAPDGMVSFERNGGLFTRARSTILAQAIHHSIEHRVQIAAALSAHGVRVVDLDALDLWAFGSFEGRGE